jgi:hypothetical protein
MLMDPDPPELTVTGGVPQGLGVDVLAPGRPSKTAERDFGQVLAVDLLLYLFSQRTRRHRVLRARVAPIQRPVP